VPWPAGDGGRIGTFLVDGFTAGTWRFRLDAGRATLAIHPWEPLAAADRAAVEREGAGLLAFAFPGQAFEIELAPPD
jgi:hypothetical protein